MGAGPPPPRGPCEPRSRRIGHAAGGRTRVVQHRRPRAAPRAAVLPRPDPRRPRAHGLPRLTPTVLVAWPRSLAPPADLPSLRGPPWAARVGTAARRAP